MEFGILGPLLVRDESGVRAVRAGKHRILLAALLARPGQTVRLEVLADLLWDGRPPITHVATMRNYVMRLRRSLGSAGHRLKTGPGGYRIALEKDELDVSRFTGLRAEGAAAYEAGEHGKAARLLGDALAVWRGPVLEDVPSELLRQAEAPRLERMRQETAVMKAAAERTAAAWVVRDALDRSTSPRTVRPRASAGHGRTPPVQEQGLELSVPAWQFFYCGPAHADRRPGGIECPMRGPRLEVVGG